LETESPPPFLLMELIVLSRTSCFKCEKFLTNVSENYNQPMSGLEFTTYGHYGSSFFDPMDGSQIAINICDDCLKDNKEKIIRVIRYNHPADVDYVEYESFGC